jgi:hypothetical protein
MAESFKMQVKGWVDEQVFCDKDDKKCLGVAERCNRTIKRMMEKYLTKMDSNRWIGRLQDFVENYNSSYHSTIKNIPERLELFLELFDEVELIRKSIEQCISFGQTFSLI